MKSSGVQWNPVESSGVHVDYVGDGKVLASLLTGPEPVLIHQANCPGTNVPPPPYTPAPPIPAVPPPAYDVPAAIATVHLWHTTNPFPYPPQCSCLLSVPEPCTTKGLDRAWDEDCSPRHHGVGIGT